MRKTAWVIGIIFAVFLAVISVRLMLSVDRGTDVIRIGSISALTGVGVAIGEEERRGAELAIEQINTGGGIKGKKLELVSGDVSIDKIKDAVTVVRRLIDVEDVVAIVGPQWDEPTAPVLPIIESLQVPMVGADNSDQLEKDQKYEYFFSTWYDNRVGIRELLRYAQTHGLKDIAVIRPISAGFWKFTADTFVEEAPKYGVRIVDDMDLGNPLTLDFRTSIVKVKAKNPDAVFIVTSDYNQCAYFKQARELGLNVPTLGTESSGDGASLLGCPKLLEQRYFSTPRQGEGYVRFAQMYSARYGTNPQYPSAVTAYDAVMVIATGLKESGLAGGKVLRDAIARVDMEGSALPRIQFNSKGFIHTPEDSFEVNTVRNGRFVKAE